MIFLARFIADFYTWQWTDPLYIVLSWIRDRLPIFLIFALLGGYLMIVFLELKKAYGYLDEVSQAILKINDSGHLIQLDHVELKEINDTLNQVKMNIQFNERAAKEAEQRKNDLVVYLAHDLKTPLTSIIGYITLLRDEQEISPELQKRYLNITLDKAERLEDLINEFFEITRFNLTHQVLELSRIDLIRLLEQLIYEFKPMLDEKNLECFLHAPKQLEFKCDVNKIQRVLDNLLRNAVNYSFENMAINIFVNEKNDDIEIIFKNHGNTIPKEKLDRLFEQFFRLDSSRTSSTGGAGLGLSIAKEIVEQHGGMIKAESENEEIVFTVLLPNCKKNVRN